LEAFDRLILGGRDAAGVLLAVDYAESRQDDVVWLADRLMAHADRGERPVRLVLLSRGAGDWWRELVRKTQSLQDVFGLPGGGCDEVEIPERIAPADRVRMFGMAVESFRALGGELSAAGAAERTPARSSPITAAIESGDDYGRPLAVQMAALLHVHGIDAAPGSHAIPHLLDRVLGLEYEHWDKTLKLEERPDGGNLRQAIKQGVAQLTLVDGVETRSAGAALIGADPFCAANDINVPNVLRALEAFFPGADGGLAAFEPDLIGEHHVADVMDNALLDASLAWADGMTGKRRQILTVLQRATRPEHGGMAGRATALLDHLVSTRTRDLAADMVAVVIDTPGALRGRLERHVDGFDSETLAALNDALPLQTLELREFSSQVATRLVVDARRAAAAVDAGADAFSPGTDELSLNGLAGSLNNLGIRLSGLGRREAALAASEEAVAIRRRLAETRPDAFLADLARSLGVWGRPLCKRNAAQTRPAPSGKDWRSSRRLPKHMYWLLAIWRVPSVRSTPPHVEKPASHRARHWSNVSRGRSAAGRMSNWSNNRINNTNNQRTNNQRLIKHRITV
jgi:hypothetical protein